jgi:hypothetical protein
LGCQALAMNTHLGLPVVITDFGAQGGLFPGDKVRRQRFAEPSP